MTSERFVTDLDAELKAIQNAVNKAIYGWSYKRKLPGGDEETVYIPGSNNKQEFLINAAAAGLIVTYPETFLKVYWRGA